MRDRVEIGSSPANEDCVQMGHSVPWDGYRARAEMRALIAQLRRLHGPEPEGARLAIRAFNCGEYSEVVCDFDRDLPAAREYALACANELPDNWDLMALVQLDRSGIDVNELRRSYTSTRESEQHD